MSSSSNISSHIENSDGEEAGGNTAGVDQGEQEDCQLVGEEWQEGGDQGWSQESQENVGKEKKPRNGTGVMKFEKQQKYKNKVKATEKGRPKS